MEREAEEGVGVEALRDTTPVVNTRLPKEPPFGNRACSSQVNLSTVSFPSRWPKLMKNAPRNEIIDYDRYIPLPYEFTGPPVLQRSCSMPLCSDRVLHVRS